MDKDSDHIVNGFLFDDQQEAQLAAAELRKIQYLETRIDYSDLKKLQAIYEKAVREEVFKTAVGLYYLKGIRDFLVREDEKLDSLLARVKITESGSTAAKTKTAEEKRKAQASKAKEKSFGYRISITLNILLIAAVIAMFWIALNAKQPNILNYEKALLNKYAAWEQELMRREQVVRQKELELFREGE